MFRGWLLVWLLAAGLPAGGLNAASPAPHGDDRFSKADRQWWSLQPVREPPLPTVDRIEWPMRPIDVFVLRRLEAEGIEPSPRAESGLLVRRLYQTLWGLPPTPQQMID